MVALTPHYSRPTAETVRIALLLFGGVVVPIGVALALLYGASETGLITILHSSNPDEER
jgi:hypothetical protein